MTELRTPQGEATFRLLFASNPLPMWVYDVDTLAFLEVNDAAIAHYGYSRDEFLTMWLGDIRPEGEVPRLRQAAAARNATSDDGALYHGGTWQHRLKDGRIREMETSSHAIEFAGRRAVLVVANDVTELRGAQAALAKHAERLNILHDIDAAIIAADAPGTIAEAALRRLRDLLGVPRAIVNLFDLESGEVEWLAAAGRRRIHVGPGVRFPLVFMGDVEALRRGELQVIDVDALPPSTEAKALLASGVHTYMVVPMIAGGELIGAVSFGGARGDFPAEQVDIAREVAAQLAIALAQARLHERVRRQATELEQRVQERTRQLSVANERLQQEIGERRLAEEAADRANQAKSDFLSRMSHELRTPLNAILGFGQLLERRLDKPRDRESVEQIIKGGRHLLGLINEVLDISRIEAGRLSLSPEPVQVGEAVRAVVALAGPLAAARRIECEADGTALCARYVLADTQRLQQVLLNLVSNGIKYNRERGRVTLRCDDRPAGRLRITVTDTGAGIPLDLQPRLFTPFDRLGAEADGVEGTGLGLALSKRLVEAMGGAIGFESEPGAGSSFWVDLPETVSPDQRSRLGARAPRARPADAERRGTILYIEDNPSNLRLLEEILSERAGIRLISAMQGRQGLDLARQHRPDLIFADLHLPDMQGDEVLHEIKRDPSLQSTPVVMLSADATPGQVKRLLAAGAREYLTKPLDVAQLLSLVDAALPPGSAP